MSSIGKVWEEGTTVLEQADIENAKGDAWTLLEHLTHITKTKYYLNIHQEIEQELQQQYQSLIQKRASHIPLQYLTGEQEFMGLKFLVNEHVLIPRQDTEVLVELLLERITGNENILDMCTGSGCIAISLAKIKGLQNVTAVDISASALEVAKKNAKLQEVPEIQWVCSNLFEKIEGTFDVIVSNPPYIASKELEELMPEVKHYEPLHALDGKEDGLYFYRKITKAAGRYLAIGGILAYEIGYDQAESVGQIMEEMGFCNIEIYPDLAGLDRVVIGKREA